MVSSAAQAKSPAAPLPLAEALHSLVGSRDPQAWEALLIHCGPDILRLTRRILGDAALAEDACQETLLQIRAHAGSFKAPAHFNQAQFAARVWIMRIAANTAISMSRSRNRAQRREEHSASLAPTVDHTSPAERRLKAEESEVLQREVAGLPETLREPIVLRFFGELDYVELGSALACSPDAAKKRVQRGLEQLRTRLAFFGIALTLTDLSAHLAADVGQTVLPAGLAAASAHHLAWQSLLNAPAAPALSGVVPLGGITLMTKLAMTAGAVVLAGSCALLGGITVSGSGSAGSSPSAPPAPAPGPKDDKIPQFTTQEEGLPEPPVPGTPPAARQPEATSPAPSPKKIPPVPNAKNGAIKGRVKYNGVPPAPKTINPPADKKADCHHDQIISEELIVDPATRGIKWAMVRVMGVKAPPPAEPFAASSIDQKSCSFQPHVVIVAPGANLNVMNSEKVAHNFHITPLDAINVAVNRMMTSDNGTMILKGSRHFLEPEIIKMQCDIHPWMSGFIVVHDPRFAAVTGADGTFTIADIPPGHYDIVIFHELGEQTVKVEIKAGETVDLGEVKFPATK